MIMPTHSFQLLRSLIALYVSTFFSGAWAMIIPTIPVLAGEFGVSAGGAAQVITGFAFGKMAGTVLGGVLLDRKGTRFGLVGSALIAALASFCAAWAAWFWLLVFFAFVLERPIPWARWRGKSPPSIRRNAASAAGLSAVFMALIPSARRSARLSAAG